MKVHELKTDPGVFNAVARFDKTFEIRKDDRKFEQGDILHLRQTKHTGRAMIAGSPLIYTGRECYAKITYILHGPIYGLKEGWVTLSFIRINQKNECDSCLCPCREDCLYLIGTDSFKCDFRKLPA